MNFKELKIKREIRHKKRVCKQAWFRLFEYIKNSYSKKKIVFGLTSFLFLSIANIAYGANAYDIVQNGSNGSTGNLQLAGQTFKPLHNNVNGLVVTASGGGGGANPITVYLCKGTSTVFASDYNCTGTSTTFLASTTVASQNNVESIALFSKPVYTKVGESYFFSLKTANNIQYAWLTTNPYTNGGVLPTTLNQSADLYFKISYGTAFDPSYITLTSPTIAQRFNDNTPVTFTINLFNPELGYNSGRITILNKQTWTAMDSIEIQVATTSGTASIELAPGTLPNGNFRAYANLIDTNTGIISTTSNIVDFVVGTYTIYTGQGDQQYTKGGMLTEAQICGSIATSTFFGGFECAGKKLIYFSFTPNEFAKETMTNAITTFKGQFPFTVYFQLTDTVTNAIASTTLTKNDTFDIVMIDKTKHIKAIPFISSTSMPNAIGQSNTQLIRDTIGWFIWGAVAFLIFLTFKTI